MGQEQKQIMSRALDLAQLLDPPPFRPCPRRGLPGATIEHGPGKGRCRYVVERMDDGSARCPIHGTIADDDHRLDDGLDLAQLLDLVRIPPR
jgi:hypothetical protein